MMNKLYVSMLSVIVLLGSCVKEDDKSGGKDEGKLITPEIANMSVSASAASFSGALTVLPCMDESSIYYGNYNDQDELTPLFPNYVILDGVVARSPVSVRLPAGGYNFLYWGVDHNTGADSTYANVAIGEPGLRIGADLKDLSYSLRKENRDTTYFPVYDFVHAVTPIQVGTDEMRAVLDRVVAGIKISIVNQDGTPISSSVASTRILIGSIANQLNYYTAEPADFSRTVAFSLTKSADSLSLSANSTVMVFPSGESPLLTIILYLKNGQEKYYRKTLSGPLVAGNRLTLEVALGDLLVEEGPSTDFEVKSWTEKSENIDFPSN